MECKECANARWNNVAKGVLYGAGGAVATLAVGTVALPMLGFGSAGIVAGSWAAAMQGSSVMAGSVFATCQSIGVTGVTLQAATSFLATGSVVGGVAGKVLDTIRRNKPTDKANATGYTGTCDLSGATGYTGTCDLSGATGYTGTFDLSGATGYTGTCDLSGATGYTGTFDLSGATGYTFGTTDATGYTFGTTGATGHTGTTHPTCKTCGKSNKV